jgi:hypothetical protein
VEASIGVGVVGGEQWSGARVGKAKAHRELVSAFDGGARILGYHPNGPSLGRVDLRRIRKPKRIE